MPGLAGEECVVYEAMVALDDSWALRRVQADLRAIEGVAIAGIALDPDGARELVRVTTPDLLLVAPAAWSGMAHFVTTRDCRARPKVLALYSGPDRSAAGELIASGADGVVRLPAPAGVIAQAIGAMLNSVVSATAPLVEEGRALVARLSVREHEVLRAVGDGMSNSEIADELAIGQETVKFHVSALLRKAQVRDRQMLIVMVHRLGLVGLESGRPWLRSRVG